MAIIPPDWRVVSGGFDGPAGGGIGTPFREIPIGPKDGTNRVFRLSFTPAFGYVWLQLNGVVQNPFDSATAGTPEFTLSGNVITYAIAPTSSDKHWCWYFKGAKVSGTARQFSGGSDQVDYGHNDSLYQILGDLTIGIWVKFPSNAAGFLIGYSCCNTAATEQPFALQIFGSSDAWTIDYSHDGPDLHHTFSTTFENDTWYFLGIVRDSVNKNLYLFWGNGTSLNIVETFAYATNAGGSAAGSRMVVGKFPGSAGGNIPVADLTATTQQYYIWNRQLSLTELINAMQGNPSTSGMRLGCASGTSPEIDLSGNGGSGVVTGTSLVQGHN